MSRRAAAGLAGGRRGTRTAAPGACTGSASRRGGGRAAGMRRAAAKGRVLLKARRLTQQVQPLGPAGQGGAKGAAQGAAPQPSLPQGSPYRGQGVARTRSACRSGRGMQGGGSREGGRRPGSREVLAAAAGTEAQIAGARAVGAAGGSAAAAEAAAAATLPPRRRRAGPPIRPGGLAVKIVRWPTSTFRCLESGQCPRAQSGDPARRSTVRGCPCSPSRGRAARTQ